MGLLDALPVIGPILDSAAGVASAVQARSAFKHRYQDTVADMKKAGLNPALAYGQGGGNPQTSDLPQVGDSLTRATQGAASASAARAQAGKTEAETELLRAQTQDIIANLRLRNGLLGADTFLRGKQGELTGAQIGLTGAQTQAAGAQAFLTTEQANLAQLQFKQGAAAFDSDLAARLARNGADLFAPDTAAARLRGQQLENQLKALSVPEAQAMAEYYSGVGKYTPYANQILSILKGLIPGANINIGGTKTIQLPPKVGK